MIKNIFFDLDGTIIDSQNCIFSVYEKLFNELNLKLPPKNIMESFIGPPVEVILPQFVDKNDVKKQANRFREIYKQIDLSKTNKVYAGIENILNKLSLLNVNLFVCTTKNEITANKILDIFNLSKYFKKIYGSIDTIGRTLKIDVINAIFEENKELKREETILIGDTKYDYEGAKLANINIGLVKYGFGKLDKININDCLVIADNVVDLENKLIDLIS